jgi:hypothetical protein
MHRPVAAALLLTLLVFPASAQSVVVGSQSIASSVAHIVTPPYTMVDLAHPATANGTVTTASVSWVAGGPRSAPPRRTSFWKG